MHEPGVREILDIELEALAEHRLAVALLGENQAAATHTIDQMAIGDDEGMVSARIGVTDDESGSRALAAVVQNGIHADGVEQQLLGDGVDFHGRLQVRTIRPRAGFTVQNRSSRASSPSRS
jgi:hypothetical protein